MLTLNFLLLKLRRRYISLILWIFIWLLLGLIFSTTFQSLATEAEQLNQVIADLPESLTSVFNISSNYLSSVESYLSGQFMTIFTLIGSVFALYIGVGELGGRIASKSLLFWLTKDISRTVLYTYQFLDNLIFLFLSNLVIWFGLYWQFELFTEQSNISVDYFRYGFLGTWLLFTAINSLGQLLGVVLNKNTAQTLGSAIVVFSWFANSLSSLGGFSDWVKPLSIFYFFDIAQLRAEFFVSSEKLAVLSCLCVFFWLVGMWVFRNKDMTF